MGPSTATVQPTMSLPPPISASKSLPLASSSGASPSTTLPPSAFTALPPSSLKTVLSDPSALILDIRPHNSYVEARIQNALSLSVPSTLLKRPLFSLSRLADMLPTSAARERFSKWPEATRILVYDADSATIPQHTQNSNLLGLMRKFRSEGYPADREVAWLRGGFHAVWRDYPEFVDQEPPPEEAEEDETPSEPVAGSMPAPAAKSASAPIASRVLRAKHLPKAAFTSATTLPLRPRSMQPPQTLPMQLVPPTPAMPRADPLTTIPPTPAVDGLGSLPGPLPARRGMSLQLPPSANRPSTIGGAGPSGPLYSMPTLSPHYTHSGLYNRTTSYSVPGRQVAYNPFFDTIRQNLELGSRDPKGTAGEGIPLKLPRRVRRRVGELPFEWLRQIARKSRRVTESSSVTESSDYSSDSDDDVHNPKPSLAPGETSQTQSNAPSQPLRISTTARRSPAKSRSSSPIEPVSAHAHIRQVDASEPSSRSSPSPSSQSQSPADADDLTRALEDQFYKIELGEQKRLLGVMERHSMESGKVIQEGSGFRGVAGPSLAGKGSEGKPLVGATLAGDGDPKTAALVGEEAISSFPYSITAGLEKGAKNRYRNIWPFEHARVRLRKTKPDDDDYMNASYVQPLGTTKRYIATQGPLPATYTDFWTLCWEQNVHVIVMLTREIEGSSVKCGKYWEEGQYGPLRLRLLETNDTPEFERKRRESETNGGFFSSHVPQSKPKRKSKKRKGKRNGDDVQMDNETPSTIKRVFELTNSAYPLAPPRIVTQFQYLDWPDLNVPEDPRGVLDLMRQVEDTVEQSRSSEEKQWGEGPLYRRARPKKPSPEGPTTQQGSTIVVDKSRSLDQVDPITGVSLLAKENAPVLLHCSAGVGRTGGFIAVDAVLDGVRREMRKRREGKTKETATAEAASTFGQGRSGTVSARSGSRSHSRSRSRSGSVSVVSQAPEEPMEIDSSPSPSPDLRNREIPALTVPVEAGKQEVHVPVAGFTDAVPMDVDEREEPSSSPPTRSASVPAPKRMDVPPQILQASPELVNEVRRATLRAWPSTKAGSSPMAEARQSSLSETVDSSSRDTLSSAFSEVSSDSFAVGSSVQSGHKSLSSSPPTSHADSSTSAMVGKTARLSMKSPSPPTKETPLPTSESGARMRTVSNSSASSRKVGRADRESHGAHTDPSRPSMASHRLNSWRSEVHSSDMTREAKDSSSTASAKPSTALSSNAIMKAPSSEATVPTGPPSPDLKEPRKLHDDSSPPLLSTYDEPIRRVIEDMREQRMSLCQSLRQYVFVHRAIIEGALMIVDEEKRREKEEEEEQRRTRAGVAQAGSGPSIAERKTSLPPLAPAVENTVQHALQQGPALGSSTLGSPFMPSDGEREVARKRSVPEFVAANTIMEGVVSSSATASPGRQKRVASPTELTKEDVHDGVLLTKRPSVKRRQRPSDVSGPRPQFDASTGVFALPPDAR
ncbi:hypothetical protein FKP32DRAFT_1629712 [Trametes sanguinea]|nr:hypothetical protein FKP32DRAFT_1629712 [Trametes sanguinea]